MYVRKTYIAEDGKEFKYEGECRAYEAQLFEKLYAPTLKPFIELFNKGGKPDFCYYKNDIYFVYVKQVPDWDDEKFMDIWDRTIPEQLTTAIGEYGEGWFFKDDYNNWYSWTHKEKMHEKMKQSFAKMYSLIANE